jgi:hypothetical protein
VAGPHISRAWDEPALAADTDVQIEGIDYADLKPFDDAYLGEVRDHLSFWPRLIGARWHGGRNDVVDLERERSVGAGPRGWTDCPWNGAPNVVTISAALP